jgi:hypothetical protein
MRKAKILWGNCCIFDCQADMTWEGPRSVLRPALRDLVRILVWFGGWFGCWVGGIEIWFCGMRRWGGGMRGRRI